MGADSAFWIGGAVQISVFFVALFSFLILGHWFKYRNQEREAFYKSEILRRITEASGEGAKAAIDLLREDDRLKRIKARESMKISGSVCIAVGIGLTVLFPPLGQVNPHPPFLIGVIPGLIGVALLIYVYFMAPPVDKGLE
jgi:hypothetical protein